MSAIVNDENVLLLFQPDGEDGSSDFVNAAIAPTNVTEDIEETTSVVCDSTYVKDGWATSVKPADDATSPCLKWFGADGCGDFPLSGASGAGLDGLFLLTDLTDGDLILASHWYSDSGVDKGWIWTLVNDGDGTFHFEFDYSEDGSTSSVTSSDTFTLSSYTWYYFACGIGSSQISFYVDESRIGDAQAFDITTYGASTCFRLFAKGNASGGCDTENTSWYCCSFRFSYGIDRWEHAATITPPTGPYTEPDPTYRTVTVDRSVGPSMWAKGELLTGSIDADWPSPTVSGRGGARGALETGEATIYGTTLESITASGALKTGATTIFGRGGARGSLKTDETTISGSTYGGISGIGKLVATASIFGKTVGGITGKGKLVATASISGKVLGGRVIKGALICSAEIYGATEEAEEENVISGALACTAEIFGSTYGGILASGNLSCEAAISGVGSRNPSPIMRHSR